MKYEVLAIIIALYFILIKNILSTAVGVRGCALRPRSLERPRVVSPVHKIHIPHFMMVLFFFRHLKLSITTVYQFLKLLII